MAVSEEIQRQVLAEATSVTPYAIDYGDEEFKKVDEAIAKQETQIDQTYGGMISEAGKYYDDLKNATQQWADKQSQIQQENTDFAIEKIEQEKDQAHKDYLKEQSGSYVDWQKQSNKYGVEAEKLASAGLDNSGFSESSQVSMYNTYQNRVATARESYAKAVLNYNNSIKEAQLQNNAALAEIAYQALEKQLELSLEGFQYKNQLITEQLNKKNELENTKWNRYQDVLQQMNTENALAEEIRQYNETQKWQTEQAELDRQFQLKRDEINREFEAAQAELDRKHDKELLQAKSELERKAAEEAHKRDMEKLKKEQEYALAQLDKELANNKALLSYENSLNKSSSSGGSTTIKSSGSSSSGSSSSGKSSTISSIGSTVGSVVKNAANYAVNTAYYRGAKNPDCKYGTFSNGYQPNNVNGSKLTKTGETITVSTSIKYGDNKGQKVKVTQNVWKDTKGNKWIWDGVNNKYVKYSG